MFKCVAENSIVDEVRRAMLDYSSDDDEDDDDENPAVDDDDEDDDEDDEVNILCY